MWEPALAPVLGLVVATALAAAWLRGGVIRRWAVLPVLFLAGQVPYMIDQSTRSRDILAASQRLAADCFVRLGGTAPLNFERSAANFEFATLAILDTTPYGWSLRDKAFVVMPEETLSSMNPAERACMRQIKERK